MVKLEYATKDADSFIEYIGRGCYGSLDAMTQDSNKQFIENLIKRGHTSVLEHASATFYFTDISRVFSHQLVRHRVASPTQRSQRYCKESNFNYTTPATIGEDKDTYLEYVSFMDKANELYMKLLAKGIPQQDARFILPNACHTSIHFTANFREWRHIIELRCDSSAQLEIRENILDVLRCLFVIAPSCFGDLYNKYICDEKNMYTV